MVRRVRMLLVRHGQSTWNAAGRWQGQADPPLSDLGRLQAKLAAAALPTAFDDPVTAVWTSDLRRASETARIIADELGGVDVTVESDLRERDAGEWSGLTRDEIEERYPGYLEPNAGRTSFGPSKRRRPPGWEGDRELHARAVSALERIAERATGDVLVVTHGGLIYTLEASLGEHVTRLANAEGRWVVSDDGGLGLGERKLLLDDDDPRLTVPDQI